MLPSNLLSIASQAAQQIDQPTTLAGPTLTLVVLVDGVDCVTKNHRPDYDSD